MRASYFTNINKILVIKFGHIGDVLLTVPAIRALKETFPGNKLSVVVNSGTEEVLSGNPLIDELIVFDKSIAKRPLLKKYGKEVAFMQSVRGRKFDMAVSLSGGDRAAILSFLSGARYRLGPAPEKKGFPWKKFLYTHLADVDWRTHTVLQNMSVVGRFGITTDNTSVDFFVPEAARQWRKSIFHKFNVKDNDRVVHIHPISRWMFKCWSDEYMAEIIAWLTGQQVKVIITSSPERKEIDKVRNILSYLGKNNRPATDVIDLAGMTTIAELGAISERASLFFGVDSAPMHIAAALNTPVVALFGPSGQYGEWYPYGAGHHVITKDLPCKPCKKGMCEDKDLRDCMAAIKPEDVMRTIKEALSRPAKKGDIKDRLPV